MKLVKISDKYNIHVKKSVVFAVTGARVKNKYKSEILIAQGSSGTFFCSELSVEEVLKRLSQGDKGE